MPTPRLAPSSHATIADVAKRADVSIATVSRVVNKTARVDEVTAERVRAAIADLKYRPRSAARNLASRRTDTIGLLLPEVSGEFFSPMLRGIEAGLNNTGFELLISTHITGSRHPLGAHNTDGLLVFTNSLPDSELAHLHHMGFPLVLLYQSPPAPLNIPCVTIENKSGARTITDHLIEAHGCRRIAFLAGPKDNEDSHWREIGYRDSLAAHTIAFDPALVAEGGFDEEEAKAPVRGWLKAGLPFDAIFASDDESAIGVINALRDGGKRVPDDVAVVGFDDMPLSRHVTPPLTTVRAPTERVGYEAASLLVKLIRTGEAEPLILLPTELVIRHSCGCK